MDWLSTAMIISGMVSGGGNMELLDELVDYVDGDYVNKALYQRLS